MQYKYIPGPFHYMTCSTTSKRKKNYQLRQNKERWKGLRLEFLREILFLNLEIEPKKKLFFRSPELILLVFGSLVFEFVLLIKNNTPAPPWQKSTANPFILINTIGQELPKFPGKWSEEMVLSVHPLSVLNFFYWTSSSLCC